LQAVAAWSSVAISDGGSKMTQAGFKMTQLTQSARIESMALYQPPECPPLGASFARRASNVAVIFSE
jgi:hypothetical protein